MLLQQVRTGMAIEQHYCRKCGRATPHILRPAGRMIMITCTVCRASNHIYNNKS